MMAADPNSEAARQAVVIAAPTRRCGTTLLQRALNSSREMIVYGEDYRLIERYPELLKECTYHFSEKCRRTSHARELVMKGIYDFDASMLYPDYDGYVKVISTGLLQLYRYYAERSLEYGFRNWGIKHNIRSAEAFISFVELFPRTRYIFITRNVVDVAKSEKARFGGEYRGPADYAALALRWSRNVRLLRSLKGERFLKLEHEEVVEDPAATIERIAKFCGLAKIDARVFQRRVNVSPVLDTLSESELQTEYRPPQPLSPAEAAALLKFAGALLTEPGYARLDSVREAQGLASQ